MMKIVDLVGDKLINAIKEIRTNSENYEEIVFFNKDVSEWLKILTEKLGAPLLSTDQKVTETSSNKIYSSKKDAAFEAANSHGGIRENQILYYGSYKSQKLLIMIWPWQDNLHTTLKKVLV